MMCTMHGMRFGNAGYSIPEASRVDYILKGIEKVEEGISVETPSKQHRYAENDKNFLQM
jgi:hypothetical protein